MWLQGQKNQHSTQASQMNMDVTTYIQKYIPELESHVQGGRTISMQRHFSIRKHVIIICNRTGRGGGKVI